MRAQRLLRDAKSFRSLGKAAFLGDHDEVVHTQEVHTQYFTCDANHIIS